MAADYWRYDEWRYNVSVWERGIKPETMYIEITRDQLLNLAWTQVRKGHGLIVKALRCVGGQWKYNHTEVFGDGLDIMLHRHALFSDKSVNEFANMNEDEIIYFYVWKNHAITPSALNFKAFARLDSLSSRFYDEDWVVRHKPVKKKRKSMKPKKRSMYDAGDFYEEVQNMSPMLTLTEMLKDNKTAENTEYEH